MLYRKQQDTYTFQAGTVALQDSVRAANILSVGEGGEMLTFGVGSGGEGGEHLPGVLGCVKIMSVWSELQCFVSLQ